MRLASSARLLRACAGQPAGHGRRPERYFANGGQWRADFDGREPALLSDHAALARPPAVRGRTVNFGRRVTSIVLGDREGAIVLRQPACAVREDGGLVAARVARHEGG